MRRLVALGLTGVWSEIIGFLGTEADSDLPYFTLKSLMSASRELYRIVRSQPKHVYIEVAAVGIPRSIRERVCDGARRVFFNPKHLDIEKKDAVIMFFDNKLQFPNATDAILVGRNQFYTSRRVQLGLRRHVAEQLLPVLETIHMHLPAKKSRFDKYVFVPDELWPFLSRGYALRSFYKDKHFF